MKFINRERNGNFKILVLWSCWSCLYSEIIKNSVLQGRVMITFKLCKVPRNTLEVIIFKCIPNDIDVFLLMIWWAAWRSGLHDWLVMWRSWVRAPLKASVVSLTKKLYPNCLALVGSRNGFERDFTIELKLIEGLMEDWLKCQISSLVKYRQNRTKYAAVFHNAQRVVWNHLLSV